MHERIAVISGDHRRHLYYVNEIAKVHNVVGGVFQTRENMKPEPPKELDFIDHANWMIHFATRDEKERIYFGEQKLPDIELLKVTADDLSSENTANFIKSLRPDTVLIFGTGMLREPLVSALPKETINLHLGLSPRYRGAATLFWPFYFLEPNWAGTTFHYIEHSPDAGDIVHQVVPKLKKSDGIHDVACKAVIASTVDAIALLKKDNWQTFTQKPEAGKNFLASDFKPQHLRVIYQQFGNSMVRAYLEGRINPKEPNLKKQL